MKPLNLALDGNRSNTFARPSPDYIDARVLAASTNETHTVPAGANFVVFSATNDFYAKYGGAAAVPAADVTDGTGSELNPSVWEVVPAGTFGLISPTACVVTLSFYTRRP